MDQEALMSSSLMHSPKKRDCRVAGFTLIELMIAVALIAILAAIAHPQYASHIAKARRTDAKTALLGLAARQEQFFSSTNTYSEKPEELGYGHIPKEFPVEVLSSSRAYYKLYVKVVGPTYLAQAMPFGPQASDKCGTYEINEQGVQTNSGKVVPDCW